MPIPTFDEFFRPFLALLASDGALHMRDVRARLEAKSGLTSDELSQRLPSGQFTVVENRIGWARTYLFKAGLIERVARATYQINDAGRRVLAAYPRGITLAELRTIPALREWLASSASMDQDDAPETPVANAPADLEETRREISEQPKVFRRRGRDFAWA